MKLLKNIAIILAAVFFWPLGIIFVWVFTKWSRLIKIFLSLPLILIIFTLIYMYIAQPFKIVGRSMQPALVDQSYLAVLKLDKNYERGEIVIYRNPESPDQDMVGRIIGLPEEDIEIYNGYVYINKKLLKEPYAPEGKTQVQNYEYAHITLDEDSYYIMGDNRELSSDSRTRGPIKKELIQGTYWFTYYKP